MFKKVAVVPDAWEDDWESQLDKPEEVPNTTDVERQVKATKAERLAKHAEANKQIWDSAETPDTFHFLATRASVPLKSEFKPALKVLSRKPPPKVIARQDPITGLAHMTIEDDDDDDEESKRNQPTAEERRIRAQREREEKQKKYEEVRARLFGNPDPGSESSSPGNVTPPFNAEDGRSNRGKNRGRGGNRQENRRPDSQSGTRELFDPNHTLKSGVTIQKRGTEAGLSGRSTPREEEQVIRAPRGPDGSGRRGFGFASRSENAG